MHKFSVFRTKKYFPAQIYKIDKFRLGTLM